VVPNTVISRITGVPPGDDEVRFRRIAQTVIAAFMPFTPEEMRREAERSFQELSVWVRELVAKRRAHPEEDLVTDLVNARTPTTRCARTTSCCCCRADRRRQRDDLGRRRIDPARAARRAARRSSACATTGR
jgi:hypothetical protein